MPSQIDPNALTQADKAAIDAANAAMARSFQETKLHAIVKVLTEARRKRRETFEADRRRKLAEAVHDLARCRRMPWYRKWVKRVDRTKYRVNKDHPKGKYRDGYAP